MVIETEDLRRVEINYEKDEYMIYILGNAHYHYFNGQRHNDQKDENGLTLPAYVNTITKSKSWYHKGQRHRIDVCPKTGLTLPAVDNATLKIWIRNGKEHRTDIDIITELTYHSCIMLSDNDKTWAIDGKEYRNVEEGPSNILNNDDHHSYIWKNDGPKDYYININSSKTLLLHLINLI